MVTPPPATPIVNPVEARQPYSVITLRGQSAAKRIVVEGAGNPVVARTLPGEAFCVDVPTPAIGAYVLKVYAQGADGQLSETPATVNVEHDAAAPAIAMAETCSGEDPAGCQPTTENCSNGRDDDCDGLRDDRDPDCATCTDDLFEENDRAPANEIDPGRYDGLQLCPGDADYYLVSARQGQTITARLFFVHSADGDLDLQLRASDGTTVLERSTSSTSDEMVTYASTATGAADFYVLVYAEATHGNAYTLDLAVD